MGDIVVAGVDRKRVTELLESDEVELERLTDEE
jgi:hypothetical protein